MLIKNGLSPGEALSVNTVGSIEDAIFFIIAIPTAFTIAGTGKSSSLTAIISKVNLPNLFHVIIFASLFILIIYLLSKFNKNKLSIIAKRLRILQTLKKIDEKSKKFWFDFKKVYYLIGSRGKILFSITLIITSFQWISRYSVITVLLLRLGIRSDPIHFFALQWVIFTLLNFVPTPGAMGGAEAAFFLIYHSLIPQETIGIVTAGWRFLTFYLILGVASFLFYLINLKHSSLEIPFSRRLKINFRRNLSTIGED